MLRRSILPALLLASPSVRAHDDVLVQIHRMNERIAQAPERAALYLARAELYRLASAWDRALRDCERALELDSELSGPELLRGRVLFASGHPRSARIHVDRHLAVRPDDAEAFVVRARIEGSLHRITAALRDYGRAIELSDSPAPELFLARADLGFELGPAHATRTLADLDAAEARLGFVPTLQSRALDLELAYGRVEAALSRLDRLLERVPPRESWLCRRGEILYAAGRHDDARRAFSDALAALSARASRRTSSPALAALRRRIREGLDASCSTPPD